MSILYTIGIYLMSLAFRAAAPFNRKAALWCRGRRGLIKSIREAVAPGQDVAWFHAASLGEFEQGRPVIEAFRAKYPGYKILLTFFSPSGYEVRKDYGGADWVFYLPTDTPRNARRFVAIVKPKVAVFIKYEFWANYLRRLKRSGCRTFLVSAIFGPEAVFFRWYGGFYRRMLSCFEHLFVQDGMSEQLLADIGFNNVAISGDTRFDRVAEIASAAKRLPIVESLKNGQKVFVAGSTWAGDEELILALINGFPGMKFIIAPHEIDGDRIERLRAAAGVASARYTQAKEGDDLSACGLLFIDTIGILSSVYSYGDYAHIGGGFGVGIHNILEAAAFGLPLTFGPNYGRFKEARDLIAARGAVSVENYEELAANFTYLQENPAAYKAASDTCRRYVEEGGGATAAIMKVI